MTCVFPPFLNISLLLSVVSACRCPSASDRLPAAPSAPAPVSSLPGSVARKLQWVDPQDQQQQLQPSHAQRDAATPLIQSRFGVEEQLKTLGTQAGRGGATAASPTRSSSSSCSSSACSVEGGEALQQQARPQPQQQQELAPGQVPAVPAGAAASSGSSFFFTSSSEASSVSEHLQGTQPPLPPPPLPRSHILPPRHVSPPTSVQHNRMQVLPADGLLSPTSSSSQGCSVPDAAESSNSSSCRTGGGVPAAGRAQHSPLSADTAASRAAPGCSVVEEGGSPVGACPGAGHESAPKTGGVAAAAACSSGSYSDLASRMAAGRARRAQRSAMQAQGRRMAGGAAPLAAAAGPAHPARLSPAPAVPLAGDKESRQVAQDARKAPAAGVQTGSKAPLAARDGGGAPLHAEVLPTQTAGTLPSGSRVRPARQSCQGQRGGEAGQGAHGGEGGGGGEEEEGGVGLGQARKRHRVSEQPVSGAAARGALLVGEGDKGTATYVAWAPSLPPVSHALDPCPTSPSPCSSASPPAGGHSHVCACACVCVSWVLGGM